MSGVDIAGLVDELRNTRTPGAEFLCLRAADALLAQAAELEEARTEERRAKLRGDNHWETLKGIRDIARTTGDLERIILWVNDSGSGYVERPEATIAELMDRATEATRQRDEALAALKASEETEAGLREALKPFGALADAYFYRYETRPGVFRESHQDDPDDRAVYGINRVEITTGDFRRARSALVGTLADATKKDLGTEQREAGV